MMTRVKATNEAEHTTTCIRSRGSISASTNFQMTNHIWFRFFAFNSFPCGSSISFDFSYLIDGTLSLSLPFSLFLARYVRHRTSEFVPVNVERRKLFPFYSFRLYGERDGKHKSLPLGAPSQKWNWWLCSTEFVAADEFIYMGVCACYLYLCSRMCVCVGESFVSVESKSVNSASKARRQNLRRWNISIVKFDRWRCVRKWWIRTDSIWHWYVILACLPTFRAILCRHNVCAIQLFVCRSYLIFLCAKLVFHPFDGKRMAISIEPSRIVATAPSP